MRKALLLACALLCAAGSACSSSPGRTRAFGHHGERLVLTPTKAAHRVSHAAAVHVFAHPFTRPTMVNARVVFEGLVRLHAVGLTDVTGGQTGALRTIVGISTLEGRVVWVRVTRGELGAHSCPLVPSDAATIPAEKSPPFDYATVVDATTGDEADWTETLTGFPCPRER